MQLVCKSSSREDAELAIDLVRRLQMPDRVAAAYELSLGAVTAQDVLCWTAGVPMVGGGEIPELIRLEAQFIAPFATRALLVVVPDAYWDFDGAVYAASFHRFIPFVVCPERFTRDQASLIHEAVHVHQGIRERWFDQTTGLTTFGGYCRRLAEKEAEAELIAAAFSNNIHSESPLFPWIGQFGSVRAASILYGWHIVLVSAADVESFGWGPDCDPVLTVLGAFRSMCYHAPRLAKAWGASSDLAELLRDPRAMAEFAQRNFDSLEIDLQIDWESAYRHRRGRLA